MDIRINLEHLAKYLFIKIHRIDEGNKTKNLLNYSNYLTQFFQTSTQRSKVSDVSQLYKMIVKDNTVLYSLSKLYSICSEFVHENKDDKLQLKEILDNQEILKSLSKIENFVYNNYTFIKKHFEKKYLER